MPFDSYIKPQHEEEQIVKLVRCMPFDSYIKPQLVMLLVMRNIVVCLLIPTSNHNLSGDSVTKSELYAF